MSPFIRQILGPASFPRMRKQLDKIEPQTNRPVKTVASEVAKQQMKAKQSETKL